VTAKKATAKKPSAKKAAADPTQESKPQTVEESAAAPPEVEGEAYRVGYIGVSQDDEDYSVAAQVAKLDEE
jgi:hypothetical protein